ncbi:CD109 antigen-like [Mugil cephalus]|uniref:CD109 antigen-like n=1 Tax=Mugil cephalus TaxID=48193 RepID=UPI001FB623D3|nr:CD109 antigen-like [Mugil cephalus]
MNRIWSLVVCLEVVCFAASGSTQNSSGMTLFLVSGPEVVRAGTPTPLAVTVFADFPSRVTAEVTHADTKVTLTEELQGGLTSVLTLPPIPDSITHNSLLNLTVRGYKGDGLIFTNTTTLSYSLRNVSSFIQTNRSRYRPGDTVRVRVVSVKMDNRPYKGRVDIAVLDPSGNVADRWESTGTLGIVLQEFSLPQTSPLGEWTITSTVNGMTDEKTFIVDDHERFEVLVKTPSQVLVGDHLSGLVRAVYSSGQPVHGTLSVSVTVGQTGYTQTKEIYGSAQFFFSEDQLQALHSSSGTSHVIVHVSARVNDSSTGFEVNGTTEVHLMQNAFQLTFLDFPQTLKPSLHFSATLRISTPDRKPLSTSDLMHSAVVEVTQTFSNQTAVTTEATTLTPPVPEDGNVHIKFQLRDHVVMLFIRARFQSSEETLKVYTNYSSSTGSYIQISHVEPLPAQIGLPLQLNVESTFQPTNIHFVVSSKGQVVAAGTKNSSSFSLTPTSSWYPEACVTVYCLFSQGEVDTDMVHIPINQHNNVQLKWSSDRAQPGARVSLTVTTLESRSQVGVVVMGMHGDAPQADLDLEEERECNLMMLTNARLSNKMQPQKPKKGGFSGGDVLMVQKYWNHWMDATESLQWFDASVRDLAWTSGKITVPDGVTSLSALALVMSENLGLGFTEVPQKLIVTKDFSLSLAVPSHLIRGEEIVLEVNTTNHLEQDIDVIVLLAQSEAFEFVLTHRSDVSVINAQKIILGSHASALALFPIRPLALGEMEISVDAVSAEASDGLVQRVMVKPEGVEHSSSKTVFLELEPGKHNNSVSVSFSFPADVVPGSQRAHMALVGDILALSINTLDSLVQIPVGCGEQNMIHFAPSVYVLQYLDALNQKDEELRTRAKAYMMEGYKRQLSYQRADGSFSAFGASDTSGSTWLTAFVLRCFIQAQRYMHVDQSVLTRAMDWLLRHQGPQGEFSEVGRLIHTEMQGGLDNGPVALTAYVLVALLEDDTYKDMYTGNVSLAQTYLEDKVSSGVVSNYSLCLVAYALSLANSRLADSVLTDLTRRADYRDGVMMWTSSAGPPQDNGVRSAQIEMASYVLLTLLRRGRFLEGFPLLKWLGVQRNHLGGYGTTQDTVVGIEALSYYAVFSGASAIELRLNVSAPASLFVSTFQINSTNYKNYQTAEITADKDLHLNIDMEGRGFATFQLNVFYNLPGQGSTQNHQHATDSEAFLLNVRVAEDRDHNHMTLSLCTRLKDSQVIPHTGMVILDVGMLSGFILAPGAAAAPTDLIRKVEIVPEKVSLYLDSVNKSEVCIQLPIVRNFKVAHVQDAVVQVYDYYEPTRKATATYNSDFLHSMDSCFFCGVNCDHCRPGITITVSSPLLSRSIASAAYSLSCVLLGVSAFLVLI